MNSKPYFRDDIARIIASSTASAMRRMADDDKRRGWMDAMTALCLAVGIDAAAVLPPMDREEKRSKG